MDEVGYVGVYDFVVGYVGVGGVGDCYFVGLLGAQQFGYFDCRVGLEYFGVEE